MAAGRGARRRGRGGALASTLAALCVGVACSSTTESAGPAQAPPGADAAAAADGAAQADASDVADARAGEASADAATDAAVTCGDTSTNPLQCGACGHSCLGEPCTSGVCGAVTVQTGGGEYAVMVDAAYAYWVSGYSDVFRSPFTSGAVPERIADAGNCIFNDAAVDASRVVWTCRQTGVVGSAPLPGGAANVLGTSAYPTGIALDATNAYWCDGTRGGAVFQAPKGTQSGTGGTTIATEDDTLYCVEVQVAGGYVYWLAIADLPDTAAKVLRRVPIGGGTRETLVSALGIRAFAVDAAHLYWATPTSTIERAGLGGQAPATFLSGEDATRLAVDGGSLFWGTSAGRVRRARASDGSERITLAAATDAIVDLAVGPAWVVFLSGGNVLRAGR